MPRWRDNPADVRPMLASLEEPPVVQSGLVYEPKYDGIRAIVDLRPGEGRRRTPTVAIYSRNGREKHRQFPEIVAAFQTFARGLTEPVLFDGEIVAVDSKGHPLGFQHIQGRIHLTAETEIAAAAERQPTSLVLFDLLRAGDEDLRGLPLAARRLRLQKVAAGSRRSGGRIRLSEITADDGRSMLARAKQEGWEGLIVKDGASIYHSGRRTPAWRKLKLLAQQEFVVGGWTAPRQTRQHFGALLVGYIDKTGGLQWSGSVGTGFDQKELDRIAKLLQVRARARSPFAGPVKTLEPAHWVRPDLVAVVRFAEWTNEGLLRQPVYLGMRQDKSAKDVRKEAPRRAAAKTKSPSVPKSKTRRTSSEQDGPAHLLTPASLGATMEQLTTLEASRKDGILQLPNGDQLRVTNLAKALWPALGITKGDLLRYYAEVAPLILPTVRDRPLVMKRFPNGIAKPAFYQQRHPEPAPPGVRREVLPEAVEPIDEEGPRDRLIGGSLTTLIYMAQLAAISQDPWFSRVSDPMHADYVALDLDPGPGVRFDLVLDLARVIKRALDFYEIPAWPKTSGSRGLHIYIPLPPRTSYESGQLLCQMLATVTAEKNPKMATVERMVNKRPKGTIYVDYLQNILGKTLATAYSVRASEYAGVSTPLTWKEVEAGIDPHHFTIRTGPARFRDTGDLWAGLRTATPVDLRALLKRK